MTINLTAGAQDRIKGVMDRTEFRTPTEFFQRAIAFYDLVTEHVTNGGKIVFRHLDGGESVIDPITFQEEGEDWSS